MTSDSSPKNTPHHGSTLKDKRSRAFFEKVDASLSQKNATKQETRAVDAVNRSNIFSIAPGTPFLSTLVENLKRGLLIEGFDGADPLNLSRCTFYVPTRRAARSLRTIFAEQSTVDACLLPDIRPLGSAGEDDLSAFLAMGEPALSTPPPIDKLERVLLLARFIRPWREKLPTSLRLLYGREKIAIPANTADAIWLAHDLAALLDEVETQEASWEGLDKICPDDVAEWWQVSLEFLKVITASWPEILAERHLSNPAKWQATMIRARALALKQLAKNAAQGPVIVAGSTGSIPATSALIQEIVALPQGAVVLPGLDRDMDETSWQILNGEKNDTSIYSHPQYGLNKLLISLGCARENVVHLGKVVPALRRREYWVSAALQPAATTDLWANLPQDMADRQMAFADVSLVEAAGEREEALAIAIILRQTIENENQCGALVTQDRTLARRVANELKRFGIRIDVSSGQPLSETEPVTLLRLLLDCIFYPGNVVPFLSVLKHPLTRLGYERDHLRYAVERLELFALRGGTGRICLSETPAFIAERLLQVTQAMQNDFAKFDLEMIEVAQKLGATIGEAARPLAQLRQQQDTISVEQALQATISCFENFGRDETGSVSNLYAHEAGAALALIFTRLMAEQSGLTFRAEEWPEIFKALIKDEVVRAPPITHPRLAIWGSLEARMQQVDVMVLGGLNEGGWPMAVHGDPFMSRAMKAALGLEPPERRISLAAHDFQMALGAKKIVLTRSQRQDNAPCVPSRWLQRLLTVCGLELSTTLRQRGKIYLHWARKLDEAPDVPFVQRPCPTPPLHVRPKHFSVTEIDILRRDPYAIYAKKILRLRPLPELISEPDTALRGQLYHAIMAAFSHVMTEQETSHLAPDEALRIVRAEFDRLNLPLDIEAIWWPRFQLLLPKILLLEQNLGNRHRFAETISNKIEINDTGFSLSGRADRIDILPSGEAEIIDFKTGSTPSLTQARTLAAPQLALEGALLRRAAFGDCDTTKLANLIYIRLGAHGEVKWESITAKDTPDINEFVERAWQRLDSLVRLYGQENHGFLSHALPRIGKFQGDYDHLARLEEWSAGGENDAEAD